jgi:hypothetical protein
VKLGTLGAASGGTAAPDSALGSDAPGSVTDAGCDSPPSHAMFTSFTALVSEALAKDPKGVVVVFDEYGYNRSGALIVRHLVETCGLGAASALAALSACRSPGLYSTQAIQWALGSVGHAGPMEHNPGGCTPHGGHRHDTGAFVR